MNPTPKIPLRQLRSTSKVFLHNANKKSGFALVVSLSLMAFVLLLLLSISTLTQVEVQSAAAEQNSLKAKQNAILGIKTAIGQLQKLTGPDTRITAPAESIATVNGPRNVTGVWRSWEGRDHHTSGSKVGQAFAPDYTSKLSTGELDPNSQSAARFIGWLCSDALTNQDPKNPPQLTEIAGTTVPLLSSKTLGKGRIPDEVHITPSIIDSGQSGQYAWWISGENSKAQLKHEASPTTPEEWSKRLSTFSHPDANVFGLHNDPSLGKVDSLSGYNLLPIQTSSANSVPAYQSLFHDLTAASRGLLTNAATGGWKRDLSLMTEDWNHLPATGLPFFTLQPGIETSASKAVGNSRPPQLLIYPWLNPKGSPGDPPGNQNSSVVSWNALQDYCTQYRNITNSNGTISMPAFAGRTGVLSDLNKYRDQVRRYPIVARMHYVFSYSAELNSDPSAPDDERYIACLDINPAITLWNPYNVALEVESLTIKVYQPTPAVFTFTKHSPDALSASYNSTEYTKVSMHDILGGQMGTTEGSGNYLELTLSTSSGSNISLQPGESIIFSSELNSPVSGSHQLDLYPGYRTRGGFRYDNLDSATSSIKGGEDDLISATVSLDAGHQGQASGQVGLRMLILNENKEEVGFHYCTQFQSPEHGIKLTNPDPSTHPPDPPGHKLLKLYSDPKNAIPPEPKPQPFLAALLTQKVATNEFANLPQNADKEYLDFGAKGFLNSNPLAFYTRSSMARTSNYLFKFFALNSPNSIVGVPQSQDDNSFIGMHYNASKGLTHMIVSELPLNPIQSLAQLQHFEIANNNRARPYTPYAIGNSHANPFFGTKEVFAPNDGNDPFAPDHYDHSYMANHLLFDDWFVSSIAPETHSWNSSINRTKEEVYQDHLLQNIPLPNSAYLPRRLVHSKSEATARTAADLSPDTAWHNIASKLEVEGMFNINSTSVTAWSAILRNLRNAKMPTADYPSSSSGWVIKMDTSISDETPISRTSIAGSTSSTSVGNKYELGTFSSLSDQQIDALAEEIVAQIKLRGPFLSLSEFTNRQLSTNKSLAMAGAIEAALLKLSADGGPKNPNNKIQQLFNQQTKVNSWLHKQMSFPETVDGYVAYGFPGWVRQADILRSLAPVLSARDDTFIIRSYGDSNNQNTGKSISKMWCEAVVQRKADYVMPTDNSTILPSSSTLTADENVRFGRRYEIIAFRWLSPDNI